MDKEDPLRHFRSKFCFPLKSTLPRVDKRILRDSREECVYLCGNSLGLQPKSTRERVVEQLHFEEPLPAALCDEYGRNSMGRLLGAEPSSVVLMNALTVNLHLLLIAFYKPTKNRFQILIEKNAFPSDRFIKNEGKNIAIVCLSGVQYYTGQKFDMERITQAGHKQGCIVGWDLAHAIGNVKIYLDDWDYLNSGAGCIGGAYMNQKHNSRTQTRLQGWWSNKSNTRFLMKDICDSSEGIDGFRLSNASPIMVACVLSSLEIFDEAGLDSLIEKQIKLTGYMECLLERVFERYPANSKPGEIITPKDPSKRGNQLSLSFCFPIRDVHEELQKRGVVCDVRLPNVIRVAPAPLYNSYRDVFEFVKIFEEVLHICQAKES
ncbi:Kynureninase [Armadillidium nasatum]|uniref:Kynureninase n=1 Tax=Armadillidium nasatum TaxID=96803 RepID=A0A5N5T5P6_9CRUS|nr:Kynureninase [Armadillidium nasatum]